MNLVNYYLSYTFVQKLIPHYSFFSDDGEEEFYYTEVEIPSTAPRVRAYTEPASQMANLSLADHLDMARPAHEDPGFPVSSSTLLAASGFRNKIRSFSGNSNKSSLLINQYHHHHHGHYGVGGGGGSLGSGGPASLTTPITIAPSMVSVMTGPAKKLAKSINNIVKRLPKDVGKV